MANWAKGYLRVKGSRENILRFIKNEMSYVAEVIGEKYGIIEEKIDNFDVDSDELFIRVNSYAFKSATEKVYFPRVYIEGTHRNFITEDIDCFFNDGENIAIFPGFEAAWGVESEPYVEKSKKYDLEIKIDVYEKGMQFSQYIYVANGELLMDEERKYDNWNWDCPCPDYGG